jgi:hypothetical protein
MRCQEQSALEEVKVVPSSAHASTCSSLVSPLRSFAIVFWLLQMSLSSQLTFVWVVSVELLFHCLALPH